MATHEELQTYKVSGTVFRVPQKYNPVKLMGKGSYGIVIAAVEKNDASKKVAIKRIKPMAGDEWDARHTLREIRIMRLLGDHPNIISLLNVRALEDHDELYITMEFMDTDLHQIIRSKQSLSEQHYKYLMLQLINGLRAMHYYNILHRDLKPGNLLVNKECQLRITDFGLSRYAPLRNQIPDGEGAKEKLTEYVVTRWYRCPELLLSPAQNYSCKVDMWSAGCIFAELMLRKPFMAGKNYVQQVQLILDMFGTPSDFGFELSEDARQYMASQPYRPARDLSKQIPSASPLALDLLSQLMMYSPTQRLSADAAATHPFFSDSPAVAGWSPQYDSAEDVGLGFDAQRLDLDQLKTLIIQEDHIHHGLMQPQGNLATAGDQMQGEETDAQEPHPPDSQGETSETVQDPNAHLLRKPSRQYSVTEDEQTQHHLDQKKSAHNMSMQAMMAHQKALDEKQKAERPANVIENDDDSQDSPETNVEEVYAVGDDLAMLVGQGNVDPASNSEPGTDLMSNMGKISLQPQKGTGEETTNPDEDLPVTKKKLYDAIGNGRTMGTPPPAHQEI